MTPKFVYTGDTAISKDVIRNNRVSAATGLQCVGAGEGDANAQILLTMIGTSGPASQHNLHTFCWDVDGKLKFLNAEQNGIR